MRLDMRDSYNAPEPNMLSVVFSVLWSFCSSSLNDLGLVNPYQSQNWEV